MTAAAVVYGPILTEHGLGLDEWRATGIPTSGVRRHQPSRIPLGFTHPARDYRIGQVVHLEVQPDRSLWAVCELDQPANPADGTFFSVEMLARKGDGRDSQLVGLALCRKPGTLGLRSARFLHGGGLEHRCNWVTSLFEKALLARAVEARRRRRIGDPIVVGQPPFKPKVQRVYGDHGGSAWLVDDGDDQYLVDATPRSRPPGKIEYSHPFKGSVLSVR